MNGILSGMPQGALMQDGMDPKQLAMLQMGLGMMQASGPSRTPVGLGQVLGQGGAQGMQAYQQAMQGQQLAQQRAQQMAMEEERMRMEREKHLRSQGMPVAHGPGTQLFRPGQTEPFHTVPFRTEPQKPAEPNPTRTLRVGEDTVTVEWDGQSWKEIARGPAFAKSVAAPVGPAKPIAPPKAPTGFRYSSDGQTLEPIPGGPKDTSAKDSARAAGAVQKANLVIGKVDEALAKTGFFSTGLTGAVMGLIPGTDAYDLDKTVDTIKANLGFAELQAMREASPTGGALGQVAVQELNMLQSTVASLDKNQKRETVEKNLKQVQQHYANWKAAIEEASAGQSPEESNFPTPPQDAIRRLKMNPKERTQFEAIFGPGSAAKALGK